MKPKNKPAPLDLKRQTLRTLTTGDLKAVAGGAVKVSSYVCRGSI